MSTGEIKPWAKRAEEGPVLETDRRVPERSQARTGGEERVRSEFVVETQGLTKRYGDRAAVEDLGLRVRRGEVYGFLGPNGAGKTTTLRMLLGLVRPTSGTARVLGQGPGEEAALARLGALVETPGFYAHLSGWDNLRVLARYSGVGRSRVETVLKQVSLSDRARDKFRSYSLGMKQRLGVAAALLKDPEFLILDEPTNGLDPEGVADMRELVRSLGRGERAVLLSSHLLSEVEQVCDRVGVVRSGRLVAEGTVAQLRGRERLLLRVSPLERALRAATRLEGVEDARVSDGILTLATSEGLASSTIVRRLVGEGLDVSEVRTVERSLEEIFLDLTQKGGKDDVA